MIYEMEGQPTLLDERAVELDKPKLLLELNDSEKIILKKRIEKWNGLIRIFIHPYYHDPNPKSHTIVEKKRASIRKSIENLLDLPEDKTPPIIIFQECYELESLPKKLTNTKQEYYVVPTVESGPSPIFEGNKNETEEVVWTKFNSYLEELGANRIIVGGSDYGILPSSSKPLINTPEAAYFDRRINQGVKMALYENQFCVGSALQWLSMGSFESVELSNIATPNNRSDQRRIERQAH